MGEVNLHGVAHTERAAEGRGKCSELAVVYSYAGAFRALAGYSLTCGGKCGNGGVLAVVESELNIGTAG